MINVLIVIVVYETHPLKSSAYKSLCDSVNSYIFNENEKYTFLIYDNSVNSSNLIDESIVYVHNRSNPGVGLAYNYAFDYAIFNNFNWVLLADQDTQFPINYIKTVFHNIKNVPNYIFAPILKEKNIVHSPVLFKYYKGWPINNILKNGLIDFKTRKWPLNSGLVLNKNIFHFFKYNINAKLDFSDFIFFENVSKNYRNYFLMDIVVEHSLSSHKTQSLNTLLTRYIFYINGLKQYCKNTNTVFLGFLFLLFRSTYLNIKNRTFKFYFHFNEYFK